MGLTKHGYTRLTYDEIVNEKILKAQALFGEDIDTSELTVLGKLIRLDAYSLAKEEETNELIYYSRYPHTAAGVSLDRICSLIGITRNPATAARYKIKVTGTAGYTIPSDFSVSTEDEITFYMIDVDPVIGDDGTCEITVECTIPGENGNVDYTSINQIVNSIAEIESVEGISIMSVGTEIESDFELRTRFDKAKTGLGSTSASAIQSALLRIPTVTSASVIENETAEYDENGRPPHSFECYITGGQGQEQEIAETIYETKPIGIQAYGTNHYTVIDKGGYEHQISFSNTEYIDITLKVSIKTSAVFEGDTSIEALENNLQLAINALSVGTNLIISTLYPYIFAIEGIEDVTYIGVSTNKGESYTSTNLDVNDWQSIRCTNVIVEVID